MNVIFISPHFPSHFFNFCARLKERGVNVLGIGDAPWDAIGAPCRNSLTEYRFTGDLHDYDAVYRAVADYIFRYGKIDYIESENEYWLDLDARIREDFNITTGPKTAETERMTHKSLMKKAYQDAGIPTARWTLPQSLEDALIFARDVGYPVVLKPDKGVGASNTGRADNSVELEIVWEKRDPNVQFIEEEYVPGHVETFDGITDSDRNVLFAASQNVPVSLMDAVNNGEDVVSYCQAPTPDLEEAGKQILKQFDTRNIFFHFEFFRLDRDKEGLGKKGTLLGLEVNMRAPGGRIPDKMNYAYDTDVYTIWADSLIYNKRFMSGEFKRYITHVGRKDSIGYAKSEEEIRARWGANVVEEFDVAPALANEMGNHAWLLRADSLEERNEQVRDILQRKASA